MPRQDAPTADPSAAVRIRWVCLDVGETLIDETRAWSTWADQLGIPRLTLLAVLGAVISRGLDHREAFALLGVGDWRGRMAEVEAAYGGFRPVDLYRDALPALEALRAAGYRTAVVANQPAARSRQLAALGLRPDVMAMSEELGAAKPDPAFFARVLERLGDPEPASVAYVGDRLDFDIGPARAAGLRAVWLRRGPWALLRSAGAEAADLVIDTLDGLPGRLASLGRSASEQPTG